MNQRFRILTLNQIAPLGLKRLPEAQYVCGKESTDPDAILVRSQDMHAMTIPASVKAIGRAGAGTNNIPVAQMNKRGVPVFNAPGANANAVKELVVAGMLLAARNIIPAIEFVRGLNGDDQALHEKVEEGKKHFAGVELPGHTLGVVGLGKIGALVADAGIKLGMNVMGFDPEITVDAAWSLPAQVRKAHSLEELLRGAQFVSIHVPLVPATRNLLDARKLDLLAPGAFLLNFARAEVVDDAAVAQALESKRLKYYICDFPAERLQGKPGVVALPHLGASTREAEDNSAVMVVDQVRDYLEHGNIRNAVNFPDVVMSRESPFRLGIVNSNVPNMVGQISTALASAGLNIHNMLNKSRGDLAYTLVDVDSAVTPALIDQIKGIAGVLTVRDLPPGSTAT
ncbi:MAG: phosphoglycerate dehydrogenase [Betaproteobacteria bacterium]|nr:phosphoglycerate dehydrogenase [Betaproteobacteria bacterium]